MPSSFEMISFPIWFLLNWFWFFVGFLKLFLNLKKKNMKGSKGVLVQTCLQPTTICSEWYFPPDTHLILTSPLLKALSFIWWFYFTFILILFNSANLWRPHLRIDTLLMSTSGTLLLTFVHLYWYFLRNL